LLREAAADGLVAIYLSTDLDELASGCDRVLVFYRGEICGQLAGADLTPRALLALMNSGAIAAASTV